MAKEGDMSLFNDVLQPFRRIINTDPPKDKLAVTKLSLTVDNESINEGASTSTPCLKRSSTTLTNETPRKTARTETSKLVTMSPWECNKLKGDLIATKAEVTKLQLLLDKQNVIRKEMQLLFDNEKDLLTTQHNNDEHELNETKAHLEDMRCRLRETKDDLMRSEQERRNESAKYDKEIMEHQKQIQDLNEKIIQNDKCNQGQISEMKKDMDELVLALNAAQSDVEMYKSAAAKQAARAEQCNNLKIQVEKQSVHISDLTNKLQSLEYEKNLYGDWERHNRATEKRLITMAELEKEVIKLRERERFLKEMVKNKLVLDEKVRSLTSQVAQIEPLQQELDEAKMQLAKLEVAVEEWVSVARIRGVETAPALATALHKEQEREIDAIGEASEARTKLVLITQELANAKYDKEKATSALADLQKTTKTQETLIRKLQKRVTLLTRERDCYREQLDCYEKDLTVTASGENINGGALSRRVQQLEKTIQGYRELLDKYDNDDKEKVVERMQSELSKTRDEAAALKCECTKLETQKDALQVLVNKLTSNTKVLHLTENPAAMVQKNIENDLAAAQEEIKMLKAALRDGTHVSPEEIAALKQQLEASKIKLQRMKEEFTSSAQEYRDVCYMLFGYKLDRTGHKNYRLSSMYAESPDEYLTFTLSGSAVEMVHTDYSENLGDLVEEHLHQHGSFPVFLSALTMELYTRTTMQLDDE